MKATILVFALLFGSLARAKEQRAHESGTLLQMESVQCGAEQKGGKTITGEMLGTDAAYQKTRVLLCQEHVLQTDRIVYIIRPKDDKHPVLLPVGKRAQVRLDKGKMKLRVEDLDDKERDYNVVSITPRSNGFGTLVLKIPHGLRAGFR